MDNPRLDVAGTTRERFATALGFVFEDSTKATHYAVHPRLGLVLLWHEDGPLRERQTDAATRTDAEHAATPVLPLPFPMTRAAAVDFAWAWLQGAADYGPRPDIDGESAKGWRVYVEGWGHVGTSHYAIVAISPYWAMYGK